MFTLVNLYEELFKIFGLLFNLFCHDNEITSLEQHNIMSYIQSTLIDVVSQHLGLLRLPIVYHIIIHDKISNILV